MAGIGQKVRPVAAARLPAHPAACQLASRVASSAALPLGSDLPHSALKQWPCRFPALLQVKDVAHKMGIGNTHREDEVGRHTGTEYENVSLLEWMRWSAGG